MNNEFVNVQAEQFVLGSILLEPELLDGCKLKIEDFSYASHQNIFATMFELRDKGNPVELMTVATQLGDQLTEIGGTKYLLQLRQAVPSTKTFGFYVKQVKDASLMRGTVSTLKGLLNESKSAESAEQLIATIRESISGLEKEVVPERSFRQLGEILHNHEDIIIERQSQKGLTGVKTASSNMDALTGGYQKQDLIIIAARPSVGKTAYMLNDAKAAAESGTVNAVGIISLEMPDLPIAERLVSSMGRIDGMKIRKGAFEEEDWQDYTMTRDHASKLPLYIDDSPGATIQQIRAKVRAFKKKFGRIIIYIDYLQLISGGKRFPSKQEEVSYISSELKKIARENDCPIVAISSLSRSVEQRQDKRPMMSDLRESGQIEFDADMVIFLYRDDYYNAESEKKNIVEVNVAKGRNTGTGLIEMVYFKNFSKFADLA